MTEFRVWAPRATRMTLQLDGARHPLAEEPGGWWATSAEGRDYGYLIDDADTPRPDPRSRWQPNGVHGLSRVFDPAAYDWQDGAWTGRQLAGGVIYELHIGTFTPEGTFDAAIERLDHLVELGVDFVEVLPVNAFNGEWNWGYDGVLWYAVQESYGGPAGYQRFVDACHGRGLAVIQDVVYNHLGPSGNHLPEFGPYLHEGRANTWGSSMNLDGEDSDEVREYIIENALMWLRDHHVDGLRLDAVHALVDHRAVHLLEELAERVDALSAHVGRPLTLIAESDLNDPKLIRSRDAHGYGITAQWSDDFHHAVHVAVSGETAGYYEDFAPLAALRAVFERGFFHARTTSTFRGREHGRPLDLERTPAWRLVVFDQDHDQIGNRAIGDRLGASVDEGGLAIAAALTLLSPFTPMLFMGEEWSASTPWQFFTSHPEPELGTATAEGRIAEFARMGWDPAVVPDPQDPETFRRSKLDWNEPYPGVDAGDASAGSPHTRMLEWYRSLIALRKARPELTDPYLGGTRVDVDEAARTVVVHRGAIAIAVNLGPAGAATALRGRVLLHSGVLTEHGAATALPAEAEALVLPARTVVALDTSAAVSALPTR
ncbi:malto-oligosyltrehalose trehalohydrolase [Agromyces aerolatus]|uniref:malto-oligosyltrehalose trehalohydrolase n=1 Tax=Agromyces sp. LY-1074 TaxID=3074080 RepID=UPI002857E305|nr:MULTISPECIES: malto-oligosyltrehalose trehalohydrolase [unclassified Agromyces]MDR5700500.1 malto-oligosyltrehalose trehalohydrolase [Agromyces sp. LY-1074]MDR5707021.1 malto-oligosyltrehalose trehalohydrolase [Agromyces sp. LY-1358]